MKVAGGGKYCEPIDACNCPNRALSCVSPACPTHSKCFNTGPDQKACICDRGYMEAPTGCSGKSKNLVFSKTRLNIQIHSNS